MKIKIVCPAITWLLIALLYIFGLADSALASGKKDAVLYSFQGGNDGIFPAGGVVFDQQGNLYGATTFGGGSGNCVGGSCGTIFELTPPNKGVPSWSETQLYLFQGGEDAESPSSGLIFDQSGNLYGVTAYGGTGACTLGSRVGCGTVFKMTPPNEAGGAWTESVIYSFQAGKDGFLPAGNLIFDAAGNLYGSTMFGGISGSCNEFYQGCGTVFELRPPHAKGGAWTERVIYTFQSGTDGEGPVGGLILDSNHNLYGATKAGGDPSCATGGLGCGTVFRLRKPSKGVGPWNEKVLHRFAAGNDGAYPEAGVVRDQKGNLYGATAYGGSEGLGTFFGIVPPGKPGGVWKERVFHSFADRTDGALPMASLTFDRAGNLYGTDLGGLYAGGTIFKLMPTPSSSWAFVTQYSFKGSPDADHPEAPLIFGKDGALYGTTLYGGSGSGNYGTVFSFVP
jgi:uncharacterized repeat protein (TIGR03803 family)